jgi:hypothetical protein
MRRDLKTKNIFNRGSRWVILLVMMVSVLQVRQLLAAGICLQLFEGRSCCAVINPPVESVPCSSICCSQKRVPDGSSLAPEEPDHSMQCCNIPQQNITYINFTFVQKQVLIQSYLPEIDVGIPWKPVFSEVSQLVRSRPLYLAFSCFLI